MSRLRHAPPVAALAVLLVLLSACGGGGGGGGGDPIDPTAYALLDLTTGLAYTGPSLPDLHSNPAYRRQVIAFRKVPGGSSTLGLPDQELFGSPVADQDRRQVTVGTIYLAVFELTRGQWKELDGSTPWLEIGPDTAVGTINLSDALPALGLSFEAVDFALEGFTPASGMGLRLPTDDEWEHACRAGATTLFAWGDAPDTAGLHARVWETVDPAAIGAAIGGQRRANAFGLYDMHGNVAEFTASGRLRGGSWSQSLIEARASGFDTIGADVDHALAGFRPVLVMP